MADNPSFHPLNPLNSNEPGAFLPESGLSLRDWFAGQAAPAILATAMGVQVDPTIVAQGAYLLADAMLAARVAVTQPESVEVYASCGHPDGSAECDICMPF